MISKIQALALTGTLAAGMLMGQALAQQPHMYAALDALRTARSELQNGLANKGGHRVKAIALIDQAIAETNAGIAAGRGN